MHRYLKQLTAGQQIGVLFFIVFGILLLASIVAVFLSMREGKQTKDWESGADEHAGFNGILKTSWFMMLVFWLGWLAGNWVALTLFGLVSFLALREFMTLSPTRRGDHRSLIGAFFVVLPAQYWLLGTDHMRLFTVFIPVYVFLAIPVISALANDPKGFLERNAKLQWGIMVCIYGMSHVPALLHLKFQRFNNNKNAFLIFFLVLVVQTCMVAQHLASQRLKRAPAAPLVSQSFNWPSWWIGIFVGSVFGALLAGITPFVPGQAFALAFIACVAGSFGHLVMKALKRDRGIPIWRGQGSAVTGAGGLLDRVDALCFAAPVFFYSVQWYFSR